MTVCLLTVRSVNSVSRLKFARLWKKCTQHQPMMRLSSAPLAQCCTSKQSETVKTSNMIYFVISLLRKRLFKKLIAHSLQFSTVAAATANMTDSSWYEYDCWRRFRLVNMTDSNLTKYDWCHGLLFTCSGLFSLSLFYNYGT